MGESQNREKIWGIDHDTFDLAVFAMKSCTRALNSNSAFRPIVPKIQAIVPKIQDHRPEKLLIKSSITLTDL
jgi:3-methyladenine DNA glycosylase AlkC